MGINKRERMIDLLKQSNDWDYVPAAFFSHFGNSFKEGAAAVYRHLAFFHANDLDIMKIQFEHQFPILTSIKSPKDWLSMPIYAEDFYKKALDVVKGVVKETKREALVLATVYSPFMCAGHTVGDDLLLTHIKEDPESVLKGMERITASLKIYIEECKKIGVDGFYVSSQGGEAGRFSDASVFDNVVKPYDLEILLAANESVCTILHICDYTLKYDNLKQFKDYESTIVNTSLDLVGKSITLEELYNIFERPIMGGMNRHGAINNGSLAAIHNDALDALRLAPSRFILGADCTVKADENRIRHAVDTAHQYRR